MRILYAVITATGKVTKEQLDRLSTCDVNAEINNGLSDDSKAALKGKRGEDIVNADVARQGYEITTNAFLYRQPKPKAERHANDRMPTYWSVSLIRVANALMSSRSCGICV